jgi:hypothetical protein
MAFMNEQQAGHRPMTPRGRSTPHQPPRTTDGEIEGVLLHIKGLVLVRALLEQRGVSEPELDEHSADLNRQRDRLAELVRDAA